MCILPLVLFDIFAHFAISSIKVSYQKSNAITRPGHNSRISFLKRQDYWKWLCKYYKVYYTLLMCWIGQLHVDTCN